MKIIKKIVLIILSLIGLIVLSYLYSAYKSSKKMQIRYELQKQSDNEKSPNQALISDRTDDILNEDPERYLNITIREINQELPYNVDPITRFISVRADENYIIYDYQLTEKASKSDMDFNKIKQDILSNKEYLQKEKTICERTNRKLLYNYLDVNSEKLGQVIILPEEL